jgi:predicted AAA+ superfamily ATPase
MIDRPFWTERLAAGWKQASIVWLTGPRRAGKTVLAQSLSETEFLNCDLPRIHFWRDKQQREVDFVVPRARDAVDAIECKWKPDAFEMRGLRAFRALYPKGKNYVVCPLPSPGYERVEDRHKLAFVSPGELRQLTE